MQNCIVKYSHHVVHYIPMTYFVTGNLYLLTPFTHFTIVRLFLKSIFITLSLLCNSLTQGQFYMKLYRLKVLSNNKITWLHCSLENDNIIA